MLQAQGLPYIKRPRSKTKFQGSLKDFLLASGKQLDIKLDEPEPLKMKLSDNDSSLGARHAKLLVRLTESCPDLLVKEVATTMTEEKLDMLAKLIEPCPLDKTAKAVEKLMKMDDDQFEEIALSVNSFKENLGKVVEGLTHVELLQNGKDDREMMPLEFENDEKNKEGDVKLTEDTFEQGMGIYDLDEIYSRENGFVAIVDESENSRNEVEEFKLEEAQITDHKNVENEPKNHAKSPIKQEIKTKKRTRKKIAKTFTCTICGKTLRHRSQCEIDRHIATHIGERSFKCDECGSVFLRVQELKRHEKIHTGFCRFRCNHCKAGFKAEIALRSHKSSIHNDQTMTDSEFAVWSFSCNQCDTRLQSSSAFGRHMKSLHGVGKPFICDTCGIGMSNPDNLKRHAKVAHTDMKPFNCEECGKTFGTKATMMKHQLEHAKTNGSLTPEQEKMLIEQSEKSICDTCGKELSCTLTLQRHTRIHDANGIKDYPCEDCGKAYTDKRNLSDHISIVHQGLKKFSCAMCGKLFGRRVNLGDHVKRKHKNNLKL